MRAKSPPRTCPKCGKSGHPGGMGYHINNVCGVDPSVRFWAKVDKTSSPTGCWLYMGGRDKWGYGDLSYRGKHIQGHRLSWRLLRGEPGTLDVLHKCHNPPCCNPDHLYLGTDADNTRDRVEAKRHAFGSKNPRAKLNEEKVSIIRREYRYENRRSNSAELAERFGVRQSMIQAVVARRNWKHIP